MKKALVQYSSVTVICPHCLDNQANAEALSYEWAIDSPDLKSGTEITCDNIRCGRAYIIPSIFIRPDDIS